MSRRASLPGADELFRPTKPERDEGRPRSSRQQDDKSTRLQVAEPEPPAARAGAKAPRHDEKVTFYCTADDLIALEQTRLKLRGDHGIAADRGRIVRAALDYVLEDFEARGEDSILLRRLT